MDEAVGCDPAYVPASERGELVVELHRQVERLKAVELRLLNACDDLAADEGARSVADWFAHHTRSDRYPVVRDAVLAEALDERYRLLAGTVHAGGASVEQARVIAQALDALPADLDPTTLARAEEHLTGLAADFPPRLLRRLGRRVLEVVAPEVAEEHERKALEDAERRAREATFLLLRVRGDGCTDLRGRVPDLVATRLATYLQAWTAPRRAHLADRADAPGIDPETGRPVPYSRLLGQAFCALIEYYPGDRLPQHGGSATTINLTVDLEDLQRRTGHATTTDPAARTSRSRSCSGWPAPPTCCRSCSTPRASRCGWAAPAVCSSPTSARRWPCATGSAAQWAAPCQRLGARPTTRPPGPHAAAARMSTTASCSVPGTTTAPTTPPTSSSTSPTVTSATAGARERSVGVLECRGADR